MARTKFQTVDEYISSFPEDVQEVLQKLRQAIKGAAPQAEEKISYQMPTYTLRGRLLHVSAFKRHIGIFGASGAIETFKERLAPYAGAKGALHFPLHQPLPYALIGDIVKFRVKENVEKETRVS